MSLASRFISCEAHTTDFVRRVQVPAGVRVAAMEVALLEEHRGFVKVTPIHIAAQWPEVDQRQVELTSEGRDSLRVTAVYGMPR